MVKAAFLAVAVGVWAAADTQSFEACSQFIFDAALGACKGIWVVASTQVTGLFS